MQKLISRRCALGKYCERGIAFTFTLTPILESIPATATQIFSSLM
jgi:hypothetical protein